MTAKLWPGDRCQEAGYPGESLCPACKRCPDNIKHRTYQCPVVKGQLPKRLCKGYLDREAVDLAADEPAKYLRGMASLKGLNVPQPDINPGTWATAAPPAGGHLLHRCIGWRPSQRPTHSPRGLGLLQATGKPAR